MNLLARQTQIQSPIRMLELRFGQFLAFLLVLLGVIGPFVVLSNPETFDNQSTIVPVLVGIGLFGAIILYVLYRQSYVRVITHLILIVMIVGVVVSIRATYYLAFSFFAITASAILGHIVIFVAAIVVAVGRWVVLVQEQDALLSEGGAFNYMMLLVLFLTFFIRYYANTVRQIVRRSQRREDLIQATAEIGQATAQILELDELFKRSVNLIRDRFGYYHVQVFLVDEKREFARLVASTGEAGRILMQRDHKLVVGSQSVIGRVTQIGGYVIARDTDSDSVHARNELLPNTRSELAIAIVDGEKIVGALDIQSVDANAFGATDVQSLQALANQMAILIRNARLFEEQAENINENKRLFFESEANLREIQRLNRQLTRRAWEDYLIEKQDVSSVNISNEGVSTEKTWTPAMIEASKRKRAIYKEDGDKPTIAVPILLRNEILGAIELEPSTDIRRDDIIELTQAIAGRLAISLDNARLFEEAQESTVQEQRINDIVQRYESAVTVDDLLQITLNELSETLGAEGGAVRLGKPQDKPPTTPTMKPSTNGGAPS